MKLNNDFILHEMGNTQALVPTGDAAEKYHGIVKVNETAAFIIGQMMEDTDAQVLAKAVAAHYGISEERAMTGVEKTLTILRSVGALDE